MVAVGKKKRPAMRLIVARTNAFRDRRVSRAIGVHTTKRTLRIRRVNDYTFASPGPAASGQSIGQWLRRAPGDGHSLQFAVSEKCDIRAIGRPEGIARSLRARQWRNIRRPDALY